VIVSRARTGRSRRLFATSRKVSFGTDSPGKVPGDEKGAEVKRLALGAGLAVLIAGLFRRQLNRLFGSIRLRTDGLDRLTKEELYQRAQEADVQGRSEMSKDELVRALQRS